MGFLSGKKALVTGIASDRSIAFGIAEAFAREGAELAMTYPNEKMQKRVEKFGAKVGAKIFLPCDVSNDESIETCFTQLAQHWDKFDIVIHSIAFAPADQLEGDYLAHIDRDGFRIAHDISSYSLGALAKQAYPMLNQNGSILTLSYLGAEKVVANYNVMGVAKASLEANVRYLANSLGPKGIRVNAISAGPIRTLAAAGISGFRSMLDYNERVAPLRKNVTIEEVGNAAAFLASDLASGITGEIMHVDAGFNTVALSDNLVSE